MYLNFTDIQEVQIDHTGRCNLQCPQCARTADDWHLKPENKGLDLTLSDYQLLLEPFAPEQIKIFHCGNFGDAIASPTFDETFEYSLTKNPRQINIATNGSLRSPQWWSDLAEKGGSKLKVIFSIDGLADTNSIYRIGSKFPKIMENAKAFIDSGGKARWDFIEFKHNYHQIDEARRMAVDLGFSEFNVKYTARFADEGKTTFEKKNVHLEDMKSNVNQKDRNEIVKTYGSFEEYAAKTNISCKSKKNLSVFVDMHMRLWPCCWFGAPLYFYRKTPQTKSFDHLLEIYGEDFNNLRKHGWSVLEHEFFASYLEKSWQNPDQKFQRIFTCGRTCGEKFEFSSGYGKNRNLAVIQGAEV